MKRFLLILLVVVLGFGIYVFLQVRNLDVEQLTDDLYVLRGFGGNVGVLRTDAGTVVVDSMTFNLQGDRIRAIAKELTGADTVLLINTHYHLDHTHGNPAFAPGTRVVATERTLSHLKALDADAWTGEAAALLPNETFTDATTLTIGGQRLELVHPGPGHTDGDLVVLFADQGVVHMGDLLFNQHYPNIDLEAGGSVQAWSATLDEVLKLSFERVIPGHGATTDAAGIREFQRFMNQLAQLGTDAAVAGQTLEETLQSQQTAKTFNADLDYQPIRFIVSLGLDREFVITRTWQEATGNFERAN